MQTPEQIAEQLVADWQAAGKMSPMAWDFRGFAAEAARRAVANGADACEQIAMRHQQTDGTYAAGKKAGAFECAEALRGNWPRKDDEADQGTRTGCFGG